MAALDMIRTMTDYNYTWQRKVWDSIMTLTDEQFLADIPYSHGSLRNHMVHLANTDSGWLRGLKGEPDARARRYNPEDYVVRESVRDICEQAAEDVTAYIAGLNEADLDNQSDDMPMTVGQTLLHLVNHGTDHRAQVLRALHDFGAPTFDQDFVFYFLNR